MTRFARLLGALLSVLLIAGHGSLGAHAAGELAVSQDGWSWSPALEDPLFEPAMRWVPGDVETRDFHVRNSSSGPARLRVEVAGVDHHALLTSGDLTLELNVGGAGWRPLDAAAGTVRTAETLVAPGARHRVAVRAALRDAAPNRSQRSRVDLTLRVLLVGVPPQGAAGQLPDTGAPRLVWVVALAAVLLGSGLGLLRRGPRETREVPDAPDA